MFIKYYTLDEAKRGGFLPMTFSAKKHEHSDGCENDSEIEKHELHYAAYTGDLKNIEKLLKNNKDVNAKNEKGRTPLYYALLGKQAESVKMLMENGADCYMRDNFAFAPYDYIFTTKEFIEMKEPFLEAFASSRLKYNDAMQDKPEQQQSHLSLTFLQNSANYSDRDYDENEDFSRS